MIGYNWIEDRSYSTITPDIALYNDDGYKGVVLEIKVPKNAKCLYIGSDCFGGYKWYEH